MSTNRTLIGSLVACALAAGCQTSAPKQTHTADLPPAGDDGVYRVSFPAPKPAEERTLVMTVSTSIQKRCGFEPHFFFDAAQPRPQDREALRALAGCLSHPDIVGYTVQLVGHADPKGTEAYNERLAMRRANNVKNVLVGEGVDASRFEIVTRGERDAVSGQPLFSEGYDRRVEINLVGQPVVPQESGVKPTLASEPSTGR